MIIARGRICSSWNKIPGLAWPSMTVVQKGFLYGLVKKVVFPKCLFMEFKKLVSLIC